ncbi:MAG: GH3 auxin-responsive promoter family protein [Bacteroidales bacterium]|nr:GH3 auxin-responsive promoter family protein [Bacteroidales bacterium]MDD2322604.1 GH3 auxin-responsive promoter family protein [Bacteroidales bacterium]MDD3010023.1 GH3 auxin-responsive promoter family protein [Bacteroidales bacterium]MDD3960950.1 GH3 auxin-responsive promoter family protein [Bacteroidales bacterium]MDY0285729.1 GH3 auxin-responsive promoter family protein [Bacteroidales bacterium]
MAILNSLVSWFMLKRLHQIELFIKYPADVQKEWFSTLITKARDTEWGKKYDYRSVQNYETYRERVPLSSYEDFKPYIDRMLQGEQNILWPTQIKWFSKSSGTTSSRSKIIPVSQEALEDCHYNGGKDMLSIFLNLYPNTNIFTGKQLAMGGSHQITEINNELIMVGDVSAILIHHLPVWAELMRVPDQETALMDEWESKIEKMARTTIHNNVVSLSGVPSWMLLLLHRILEITGKSTIREVWPDLSVFFHGGVNFGPYEQQFRSIIPGEMTYMETYNASEGFFGIQDQKESKALLMMLDYGIFYEFIPLEEMEKSCPRAYPIWEVETDKVYAMVITTNAGLWRYLIGDTIKFTSLSPYRIKIAGRTKHFINSVGEELMVENADTAMLRASKKTGAEILEYTAAPIFFENKKNGAHEWIIEFSKEPLHFDEFTSVLDSELKAVNSDYEAKRYQDMVLRMPLVHRAPKGTFYNYLKQRNKLGGQNKIPRLSNDRAIVDELLKMIRQG